MRGLLKRKRLRLWSLLYEVRRKISKKCVRRALVRKTGRRKIFSPGEIDRDLRGLRRVETGHRTTTGPPRKKVRFKRAPKGEVDYDVWNSADDAINVRSNCVKSTSLNGILHFSVSVRVSVPGGGGGGGGGRGCDGRSGRVQNTE